MITLTWMVTCLATAEPAASACPPDVDRAYVALERTLLEVEHELDNIGERALRKRLRRRLRDAQAAMQHAKAESCAWAEPPMMPPMPTTPPPPPPAVVEELPPLAPLLDNQTLQGLLAALDAEAFSDGKLTVLAAGVSGVCLEVEQAKTLLARFAFSADRLRGAKLVVPRVLDRANLFRLYEVMKFSKDKEALREQVNQLRPEPGCQMQPNQTE